LDSSSIFFFSPNSPLNFCFCNFSSRGNICK
jgi:hypothetical protein